jgi:hypothetical protein
VHVHPGPGARQTQAAKPADGGNSKAKAGAA